MARAVVLCAGFAERMGELGKKMPKAFLRVGRHGVVIDTIVSFLNHEEITSINVIHNAAWPGWFKKWKKGLMSTVADGPRARLPYVKLFSNGIKKVEDRRGAIADLRSAMHRLPNGDPVVVMPGDTIVTWPFGDFYHEIDREKVTLSLSYVSAEEALELGTVKLEPGGAIKSFTEKGDSDSRLAWLGPLWLPASVRQAVFDYCGEKESRGELPDSLGDFVRWLMAQGVDVEGCCAPSRAFDVGTDAGLREAQRAPS